jgi:putative acetyltransferase
MDTLTLRFGRIDPGDEAIAELVARHAAHGDAHYPAESNHHLNGATMSAEGVRLFAGWKGETIIAMGGYKVIAPGEAELKSMHVVDAVRGQGAGARILAVILADATACGLRRVSLETGSRPASAAARRLYERAGFSYCAPFGDYVEDPESVFMTRTL